MLAGLRAENEPLPLILWAVSEEVRGLLRLLTDLRLNTGLTVIVISHDFAGLEELCPRILHLDRGALAPIGGPA